MFGAALLRATGIVVVAGVGFGGPFILASLAFRTGVLSSIATALSLVRFVGVPTIGNQAKPRFLAWRLWGERVCGGLRCATRDMLCSSISGARHMEGVRLQRRPPAYRAHRLSFEIAEFRRRR